MLANSTGKNLHWIFKNLSVHGAALKFKPVSLSTRRKAYLFTVYKYSTWAVGFKLHTSRHVTSVSLYSYCWPFSWANLLWIGMNKNHFQMTIIKEGYIFSWWTEFILWLKREKNKVKQMKGDSTWEEFCLIHLVTHLEAILMGRQPRENLQWLYENLMSNNFCKLYLHLYGFYCKNLRALHAAACARTTFLNFLYIYFILPTKNISPDACFRFFIYLPAIFLGIIPWKIVGKHVENLKQPQRAKTCNGKL